MRTMVGEREVRGTASRLHFYPADSDKEEDSQVEEQNINIQYNMITTEIVFQTWYFGEMSRAEAEELLAHSANDQGAFLVRFSSKHKRLVVSVKTYEETHQEYRYR